MKRLPYSLLVAASIMLGACAIPGTVPINAGDSEQTVLASLGVPTHRYQDGENQLLEYARGPWGQQTYMARIGADGKLISYEQVLTTQKFATLQINVANKNDVLRTIGAPSDTSFLSLPQLEVWSYPYKENGAWNSVMHVHFDRSGILRKMQNGPDLRFDPDSRWPFLRGL